MLFLLRMLIRSQEFVSPAIILITDRADLDDLLSKLFGTAKRFIGDECVVEVESREKLREHLAGRTSGGVFLITIHKFTEDTSLLSECAMSSGPSRWYWRSSAGFCLERVFICAQTTSFMPKQQFFVPK